MKIADNIRPPIPVTYNSNVKHNFSLLVFCPEMQMLSVVVECERRFKTLSRKVAESGQQIKGGGFFS
jgi:hypothetical protein